jgi:hypothetical protein
MIESAIIDSRLAQVCRTGRWFPANPIHYHSSEISWSRVVPVGRGTGLVPSSFGRRIWSLGLKANRFMNAVHLNGIETLVSLAAICDSHNTIAAA